MRVQTHLLEPITRALKCGRACYSCPLYEAKHCFGCTGNCNIKGMFQLIFQYSKVNKLINERIFIEEELNSIKVKKPFRGKLPFFIPQTRADKRTFFWEISWGKGIMPSYDTVNVRFDELSKQYLYNLSNFNGYILISTVMRDEKLDKLSPYAYAEKLNWVGNFIGRDSIIITTIDSYTYRGDPPRLSWAKVIETVKKAQVLAELDFPQIPIVKGVNDQQIKWCIDNLVRLGYRVLAFPCGELRRQGKSDFIFLTADLIRKAGAEGLLLGCNPLKFVKNLSGQIHFSSLDWFLAGFKRREAFKFRDEGCNCPICEIFTDDEIIKDPYLCTIHNLWVIYFFSQRRGNNQTTGNYQLPFDM